MPETIAHREFDPTEDDPVEKIVQTVAELKGVEQSELRPFYDELDHIVDRLYENPPVTRAQIVVEFSYEGFRIKVGQDGNATFIPVGASEGER